MTQVNSQNLPIANNAGQITQLVQDELANSGFSIYYNNIPIGQSGVVIKDYYGDDCCNGCSCNVIVVLQGTAIEIQSMINILTIPPYNLTPYTSGNYGPNTYLLKKAGIDCRKPVSTNLPCGCIYKGTLDAGIEQFPAVGNPNGLYFDYTENKLYRRNDQLPTPAYEEVQFAQTPTKVSVGVSDLTTILDISNETDYLEQVNVGGFDYYSYKAKIILQPLPTLPIGYTKRILTGNCTIGTWVRNANSQVSIKHGASLNYDPFTGLGVSTNQSVNITNSSTEYDDIKYSTLPINFDTDNTTNDFYIYISFAVPTGVAPFISQGGRFELNYARSKLFYEAVV